MSKFRKNNRFNKKLSLYFKLTPLAIVVIAIFVGIANLKVVREFFSQASGIQANIVIDVQQERGPVAKPWMNLAQGGEDHAWSMDPILPKIRSLEPQYIRIDHVYDFYEIVKRENGQLIFDFTRLDPILEQIRASGATPFISLSYMPPTIAKTDIVSEPNDWNEWALVIQRTIEHVSGTKGFTNVYYEVWNEPDLFGGWKMGGSKNYLTLYSYAARGANNAKGVRGFKFGGPATTAQYKNWYTGLAKFTNENNLRFDFYSWHRYHRKVDQYEQDVEEIIAWQNEVPTKSSVELLITEWGHDPEIDAGYDGYYSAAHTAATGIAMAGKVNKLFLFEIEDGKDPEGKDKWGRWGVMTNQAFGAQPKPRYQVIRLMNQLTGTSLQVQGNGTWVKALASKTADNHYQVLLVNYDNLSKNVETAPISFANLIPGVYTLKQTWLGGKQSEEKITVTTSFYQTQLTIPTNNVLLMQLIPDFDIASAPEITPIEVSPPEQKTGFGRLLEGT